MQGISDADKIQVTTQIVALMNAHFQRPTAAEQCRVLALAAGQIEAESERLDMEPQEHSERYRFDTVDQDQLAAQLVALMNALAQQTTVEEKTGILDLANRQIQAEAERLVEQGERFIPDQEGKRFRS